MFFTFLVHSILNIIKLQARTILYYEIKWNLYLDWIKFYGITM